MPAGSQLHYGTVVPRRNAETTGIGMNLGWHCNLSQSKGLCRLLYPIAALMRGSLQDERASLLAELIGKGTPAPICTGRV